MSREYQLISSGKCHICEINLLKTDKNTLQCPNCKTKFIKSPNRPFILTTNSGDYDAFSQQAERV